MPYVRRHSSPLMKSGHISNMADADLNTNCYHRVKETRCY